MRYCPAARIISFSYPLQALSINALMLAIRFYIGGSVLSSYKNTFGTSQKSS